MGPNRNLGTFHQFFGKEKRSILSLMQKFGEMCISTYRDNTHWAKLANQSIPCIWVGCMEGHPTCTYWAFNPIMKNYFNMGYDVSAEALQ